ncbi:MAG TPA: DUF4893 domain-containing protein [Rhizomicrobium sp.]
MSAKLSSAALAAFALLTTPAFAGWQQQATTVDQQRLSQLEASRAQGMSEAARGRDMGAIHEALGAPSHGASASAFAGSWRCRQMKLGGATPSIVYSWFSCRISQRDGHLYFAKLSGSQKTEGWLYPDGGTFVYLGASSEKGEGPHSYSGNGASLGAPQTPDDQIGRLSMIGARHARLELPYPVQESTFDVIELRR